MRKQTLNRHIKADHNKMSYTCRKCRLIFSRIDRLSHHIKELHLSDDLTYSICDQSFDSIKLVAMQIKADRNLKDMFGCTKCSMRLSRSDNLERHVNEIHEREKSVKCSQCEEVFARKQQLTRHIKDVHKKEKNYKCSQCEVVFAREQNLTQHIKELHKKRRKLQCSQCDDAFARKQQLTRHIKHTHQKERNHRCKLCEHFLTQSNI